MHVCKQAACVWQHLSQGTRAQAVRRLARMHISTHARPVMHPASLAWHTRTQTCTSSCVHASMRTDACMHAHNSTCQRTHLGKRAPAPTFRAGPAAALPRSGRPQLLQGGLAVPMDHTTCPGMSGRRWAGCCWSYGCRPPRPRLIGHTCCLVQGGKPGKRSGCAERMRHKPLRGGGADPNKCCSATLRLFPPHPPARSLPS